MSVGFLSRPFGRPCSRKVLWVLTTSARLSCFSPVQLGVDNNNPRSKRSVSRCQLAPVSSTFQRVIVITMLQRPWAFFLNVSSTQILATLRGLSNACSYLMSHVRVLL